MELISDETGRIRNSYTYDAFGDIREKTERFDNRYTYNGEARDEITEQYYLRARYYNPKVSRFTQEDIYRGDGLNLYAFCANNPVMYVDPSGYSLKCETGVPNNSEKETDNEYVSFYTVQNDEDTIRLLGEGTPWPSEPHRANIGDGVYAWDNLEDAVNYYNIKSKRTEGLQILEFEISSSDLNSFNTLDLRLLSDSEVNAFLDTYARLNGGIPNHGYDYIKRMTGIGVENYFHSSIFDKLHFKIN